MVFTYISIAFVLVSLVTYYQCKSDANFRKERLRLLSGIEEKPKKTSLQKVKSHLRLIKK